MMTLLTATFFALSTLASASPSDETTMSSIRVGDVLTFQQKVEISSETEMYAQAGHLFPAKYASDLVGNPFCLFSAFDSDGKATNAV